MTHDQSIRRLLGFTLAACFILSHFASISVATPTVRTGELLQTQSAGNRRPKRTYDVQHYVIRTRFDAPRKTVYGETTIELRPLAGDFKSFELDASDMKIESVQLATGQRLPSTLTNNRLTITLDRPYQAGEDLAVKISYRANPRRGLYFVSASKESNYQRPAQIWTQGEPEDNHHWFPCYDFPDDKATSEQYVTTGANELAIANGVLAETTDNPDGTRTFHWVMNQPYSSYLTSLVVGDYARLSEKYKEVAVEYYTYRGTEAVAQRAFGRTPLMMGIYSRTLNFDFPYRKYSQIIIANFMFGGMENITATSHSDTEILYAGGEGSKSSADSLVAHELAHSWFGDLVTCSDWSDLWLNEGFATFMEASYTEQRWGVEAYLEEMNENMREYFREDASGSRHPLHNPHYPLSMDLFDSTTYKKGAYVIHMLRALVGEKAFWKALNTYLNEYQYSNVTTRDLQRVFEQTTGQRLDWFFDQWVYKAGYPELRVRSSYDPLSRRLALKVEQRQQPEANTPAVFRLPVGVDITTATGTRRERIEITQRVQSFSFQLDGKPRAIVFDKKMGALKKLDFPQSRAMAVSFDSQVEGDTLPVEEFFGRMLTTPLLFRAFKVDAQQTTDASW